MLVLPDRSNTAPHTVAAETAHADAQVEWWFLQGWFQGPAVPIRHFMFAFFQQREPSAAGADTIGHSLLVSHLDPAGGAHAFRSQISAPAITIFLNRLHDIRSHNLDPDMVALLSDELQRYGPPQPVYLESAPVTMADDRLHVSWADMVLGQTGSQLEIQYAAPEGGRSCRLTCAPRTARVFRAVDPSQDIPMSYATIARMALTGEVGGHPVTGESWFDHQWGDYTLFGTGGRNKRVLGWEWFGINLDDGTDLLLSVHRDMQTDAIVTTHAYAAGTDGTVQRMSSFTAHATRIWESGVTRCRYPLDWKLELPELGLNLAITPVADDQEILLFGAMRAVWEGACTVKGTRNGRSITGRARLELHGYGYILNFQSYLDRWIQRVDSLIHQFLPPTLGNADLHRLLGSSEDNDPEAHTAMLAQPVWDMLNRGGKRWRPIFGNLLLEALGKSHRPFEQLLAATVELGHLGSLIIDDIEDQSLLRRSQPTVHQRYGTDLAINAGNTLYLLPLILLENHPALTVTQRERIYQVIVRQYVRSHFGQSMDIYWAKFLVPRNLDRWLAEGLDRKVLRMYADKTGAPVVGLARVACIIAEADDAAHQACGEFAGAFGVAFQILDDVLNFSRSRNWTKTVGEDLALGKPTYVIIQALKHTRGDAAILLRRLLCDPAYRQDKAQLEKGIDIVRQSGVLEQCRQEAQTMVRQHWEQIAGVLRPSEAKTMLRLLCANLTDLTFVS